MTHVTVVSVHEAQFRVCIDEAELWDASDAKPRLMTHPQDETLTSGEDVTYCKHQQYDIQTPEVVYVNLKELKLAQDVMRSDSSATRIHEKRDIPQIHTPKRLSRKSSIIDQNVGVTGTVFMMSDPKCQVVDSSDDEESVSSLSDSVSSLSESDSGLSSTIEVGMSPPPHHSTTITITDVSCSEVTKLEPVEESSAESTSKSEIHKESRKDELAPAAEGETVAVEDPEVSLEWRVISSVCQGINQHESPQEAEGDRGSTPTSFSSAYTVTEHGSESASDDSASSRHNWSGQESDEESHGHANVRNSQDHQTSPSESSEEESLHWNPRETEANARKADSGNGCVEEQPISKKGGIELVKDAVMLAAPCLVRSPDLRQMLRRLRHVSGSSTSSGEDSIVFNYIPCRDQREKDDEELWVANEAADPRGSQAFQGLTPPLLPPPMGWGGSVGRGATRPAGVPRQGLVWAEQPRGADGCATEPSCVSSIMCTLAPSPANAAQMGGPSCPRKHYSTRQRVSEPQIVNVKVIDEEPKQKPGRTSACDSETNKQTEGKDCGDECNLPTSITTNKPTKRFSFLIRSNSVKQDLVEEKNAANLLIAPTSQNDPVTPSDQAILEKLATLNLEARNVALKPRPRASCYEPPCVKCGDPVYHQERLEPTLRLVFHSSCFKCHQCGVRLTLKTFYRSPLDSKDSRVFCRSHVPQLDPGKLDAGKTDSASSSGKSSPDSAVKDTCSDVSSGSSICRGTPTTVVQDRLDVVKCDTIGLRYF